MDESRKQFEEWVREESGSEVMASVSLDKSIDGEYRRPATIHKWKAWQASREAMK